MASFTLKIGFAPLVEELSFDLLVHVESDEILVLIVFMYEIHGMSIPFPKRTPFPFNSIISHHLHKLMNSLLQIFHILRAILDLLYSMFSSLIKGLAQNLEQKFSGKQPHMCLISSDNLLPLPIHAVDIIFISVVQLIHFPDEIISFLS